MKTEVKSYYKYWGKADKEGNYHLLAYHCFDVAAVGEVYLSQNETLCTHFSRKLGIDPITFKNLFVFFLVLHDLGKFSDCFQSLIPNVKSALDNSNPPIGSYSIRHDSLGYIFWGKWILKDERFGNYDGLLTEQNWLSWNGLRSSKDKSYFTEFLDVLIRCVTGHHGRPPSKNGYSGQTAVSLDSHFTEADRSAALDFSKEVNRILSPNLNFDGDFKTLYNSALRISFWLAGLSVLCDWIGSNAEIFKYHQTPIDLEEYYTKISLKRALEAINRSGLLPSKITFNKDHFRIFEYLREPTPLQKFCSEVAIPDSPSLFILEDVTGSGKTEAALILTHRLMQKSAYSGFYVGLPTMATANGMYQRMNGVYRNLYTKESIPSLVLAHGARNLSDSFQNSVISDNAILTDRNYSLQLDKDPEESASAICNVWLSDNQKKSLLADAGVGTIDQALLSILSTKFQSLRMFGLSRKVLILDEVHSYDPYMVELICCLLKAQAKIGASVILLSATLPKILRKTFSESFALGLDTELQDLKSVEYPLVSLISDRSEVEEIPISTRKEVSRKLNVKFLFNQEQVLQKILEMSNQGRCVCWIRNTVSDASQAFSFLHSKLGDQVILFHSRFVMGDRLNIESQILENFGVRSDQNSRKGKVVVATQVVEQSLDLDFDCIITDLAPIDLILQRAGRLHRHCRDIFGNAKQGLDERGEPILWIFSPEPIEDPTSNWFSQFSRGGSMVYSDHGRLWLTAKLLQERKGWRMPEYARNLIESVYGIDVEIPQSFRENQFKVKNDKKKLESAAALSTIHLELGYDSTLNETSWDDSKFSTRYGIDNSSKAVLAKFVSDRLVPWISGTTRDWQNSELPVPNYLVEKEFIFENLNFSEVISNCKKNLPDKGKHCVLLPLFYTNNSWRGKALNKKNEVVSFTYDERFGFRKEK
ncbi:CRISPR-associated helicase/endonuclease Cas3 [Leptospira borgpetersenii]|uniref:CRISPR-associated helicase/endonuclease Cas3 n=1 Tax=Leptospira borgpetersenii TaxID=174 RepID=UPI000774214E|nr:CRISPR-associated helicase/endonuclease Cas3 [Leptospira borgpetersenii]MBE8403387.1 CRISPR-associated helicase/endonuclease Cas3 [Leptospira borgpetersenii serovar Tarassovi]MBE8426720.1 CRISPR-associated helicase/endonuclease Cas3 [Leptospira borgpetersenii serovar Tarassovi]MBE8434488.1 CRISPR-associated helicase/endonuclease Cas3 [Leptospira borgpetersenii serovar Tarassovi]UVA64508.1 CRISPR-associated helicase/endonuclease Cas3 [Leptospira borgpetersenii]